MFAGLRSATNRNAKPEFTTGPYNDQPTPQRGLGASIKIPRPISHGALLDPLRRVLFAKNLGILVSRLGGTRMAVSHCSPQHFSTASRLERFKC